ncbi:hypothetical protein [Vulcanococcus sp. DEBay_Sum29NL08_54]|uniref:hypothetical protein n=1 Tax=Vulcanococcus sp. DEBay_Sum29NL08_54 TaxID=2806303 RepID=UPI0025F2ADC7|nr:hypothetical protein [Vulcanococcus sp. DEBay_Sum29NL08_54]
MLSPANDSTLPAGPWTLKLKVQDWPLYDDETNGLGPHLVVQLDDQPPRRISSAAEAQGLSMPELSPGSHRLTVFAARPWGEVVKAPGASQQLRLHRVARNPSQLPASGSPQLIAASPSDLQHNEPVLIDWLLIDAPLQHLRDDDARWRLRVSVNGDSFLVDRQTPLWLKGLKRGSNAVQLELLDGRGDPLNPPFNSVVREVVIDSSPRPSWQQATLSAQALAALSGTPEPEPVTPPAAEIQTKEPEAAPAQAAPPEASEPERPEPQPAPLTAPSEETRPDPTELPMAAEATPAPADPEPEPAPAEPPSAPEEEPTPPAPTAVAPTPAPVTTVPAERTAPSSRLGGSARDLVSSDGSLIEAQPKGPLAGLKAKLGG